MQGRTAHSQTENAFGNHDQEGTQRTPDGPIHRLMSPMSIILVNQRHVSTELEMTKDLTGSIPFEERRDDRDIRTRLACRKCTTRQR